MASVFVTRGEHTVLMKVLSRRTVYHRLWGSLLPFGLWRPTQASACGWLCLETSQFATRTKPQGWSHAGRIEVWTFSISGEMDSAMIQPLTNSPDPAGNVASRVLIGLPDANAIIGFQI